MPTQASSVLGINKHTSQKHANQKYTTNPAISTRCVQSVTGILLHGWRTNGLATLRQVGIRYTAGLARRIRRVVRGATLAYDNFYTTRGQWTGMKMGSGLRVFGVPKPGPIG